MTPIRMMTALLVAAVPVAVTACTDAPQVARSAFSQPVDFS